MNIKEVERIKPGTRVRHKPTGEEGTFVRTEAYVATYIQNKYAGVTEVERTRAVLIKPDNPSWLAVIYYYYGNHIGRKFSDLEVIQSVTSCR